MRSKYAKYEDINKEQLQVDIEKIKESIGTVTQEDFNHLLKLEEFKGIKIIKPEEFLKILNREN
ncbi:hypothetical protein KKG81_06680 [bacterium]|nr:hypothetical protein [bacterium]